MKLANITSKYRAKLIVQVYSSWIKKGSKVLDVGCGTGVVADYISKKLSLTVSGCDIDKYLLTDITFFKMKSISELPDSKRYDFSMFNDMLHHTNYENQITLLKESLRISEAVIIFELIPTIIGRYGDFFLNKIHNPKMEISYTYRTQQEWEYIFKKNKFKFEKKIVKRPLLYPFNHVAYKLTLK